MKFKILLISVAICQSLFFSKVVYAGNTEISDIVYENAQESVDDFVENTKDDVIDLYMVKFENLRDSVLNQQIIDFGQVKKDFTNFVSSKYTELLDRFKANE